MKSPYERDRTRASRVFFLCSKIKEATKQTPERSGSDKPPPGLPGASEESRAELARLSWYCEPASDFQYLTELKKVRTRTLHYFDLVLTSRPAASRLPVVTEVLSNPTSNDVEFGLWVDNDLRHIFEKAYALNEQQAVFARGWVLKEVLKNSDQSSLFWRTQCALASYCQSASLPEKDRQIAETAAQQVLLDLERQNWEKLIAPPRN